MSGAQGDALIEVKRCFGGEWDKDLQGKVLSRLRYALQQLEHTARRWALQVVQRCVVLFFEQQLQDVPCQRRLAELRTLCRPLHNGSVGLQAAFLPLRTTLDPIELYDVA